MIAEIESGGVWIKYKRPGASVSEEPCYPYLQEIDSIIESTTAESGSTRIVLMLAAYTNLGFPLGASARVREGAEILFEGIVADILFDTAITLQLEA